MSDVISSLIFLLIVLWLYFFPAWIAGMRKHHQTLAIFVLNLLLGWTGIGWIASLIWACTAVKKQLYKKEDS